MTDRSYRIMTRATLVILLFARPIAAHADPALQTFLEQTLTAAQEKAHLPAVATLVQIDGKIAAEAALGLRALGQPDKVTVDDRWHIGSDTKAFTATMIARLVEQHVMSFDDTLAASLPLLAKEMNPAYRDITIRQLLCHTAGLPALTDDKEQAPFLEAIKSADGVKAQRVAIAQKYLTMPPASKVGEFKYSNVGYIIAGAVAEARTGKTWEDLIREQIFKPLGIANAGFGAPGTPDKLDQPRGHKEVAGKLVPLSPTDVESDNPPALGPAGTMNIALKDWLLFAQDQLAGAHGHGKLLKPETYHALQTPVTGNYGLGWGAKLDEQGAPVLITHTGSNGFWLADIRIMPKHDMIFLITTNAATEAATAAIREINQSLKDRLKPFE